MIYKENNLIRRKNKIKYKIYNKILHLWSLKEKKECIEEKTDFFLLN
jgi:hypothetical protein